MDGDRNLIGENIVIHPESVIHNSVMGSNVSIECPARISSSLDFDGTVATISGSLYRHILTSEGIVDCSKVK